MAKEVEHLRLAFAAGHPLILLGPQGSGKTRLIREALSGNPRVLYIAWVPTLHALLAAMARTLIAARHADFIGRAKPGADAEAWLAAQTSIHLKGLLWNAMENSPVPLMLDGIAGAYMDARELFRMWSDVFNAVDVIRYREKEAPGFVDTSLP
jgi:hypothetical protein